MRKFIFLLAVIVVSLPVIPQTAVVGSWQSIKAGDAKTGQTANVSPAVTLITSAPAGLYEVDCMSTVTTAATSSSTLPQPVISFTNATDSATKAVNCHLTSAGNATTTTQAGTIWIDVKAGTNITYTTTGYASSGATAMQYMVKVQIRLPQ